MHGTSSRVVVSVAYLPEVFIHIYYHASFVIWKKIKTKDAMRRTEGMMK